MTLNKRIKATRAKIGAVWVTPSMRDDFMYIVTEVGELGDELARMPGFLDVVPSRNHPRVTSQEQLEEEIADVVIMVTSLAIELGIDVDEAVDKKLRYLEEKFGQQLQLLL